LLVKNVTQVFYISKQTKLIR